MSRANAVLFTPSCIREDGSRGKGIETHKTSIPTRFCGYWSEKVWYTLKCILLLRFYAKLDTWIREVYERYRKRSWSWNEAPQLLSASLLSQSYRLVTARPSNVSGIDSRLDGVASSSMDVPSTPVLRPLLPAERDISAGVEGFNAGLINFLKGKFRAF